MLVARDSTVPVDREILTQNPPLSTGDTLQDEFQRRFLALASVAHELKTPLAVMAGYTDLLLSGGVGPLNGRQQQVLLEMQASGERLQRFVEDFLAFSALQTGKIKMDMQVGDMNACISEICGFWAPRFRDKKLRLTYAAPNELPQFTFDCLKLQHVISNLLQNALKFTPEGGEVTV